MDYDTHETPASPDGTTGDPLTELLRRGERDLLKQAVEAEWQSFLDSHADAPGIGQPVLDTSCGG